MMAMICHLRSFVELVLVSWFVCLCVVGFFVSLLVFCGWVVHDASRCKAKKNIIKVDEGRRNCIKTNRGIDKVTVCNAGKFFWGGVCC